MSSDLTLEPPCLTSTAHCLQALRKLGATGDKKQMQSLCVFIPHPGHEASDDLCSISCPVLEERSAPSTKGVREISNACLSHLWVCLLALRTPGIPAKEGLSLRPGLAGELHQSGWGALFSAHCRPSTRRTEPLLNPPGFPTGRVSEAGVGRARHRTAQGWPCSSVR